MTEKIKITYDIFKNDKGAICLQKDGATIVIPDKMETYKIHSFFDVDYSIEKEKLDKTNKP